MQGDSTWPKAGWRILLFRESVWLVMNTHRLLFQLTEAVALLPTEEPFEAESLKTRRGRRWTWRATCEQPQRLHAGFNCWHCYKRKCMFQPWLISRAGPCKAEGVTQLHHSKERRSHPEDNAVAGEKCGHCRTFQAPSLPRKSAAVVSTVATGLSMTDYALTEWHKFSDRADHGRPEYALS